MDDKGKLTWVVDGHRGNQRLAAEAKTIEEAFGRMNWQVQQAGIETKE